MSKPHGGIRSRKSRMDALFRFIEEQGKNYDKDTLLAFHSIHEGTSERTLKEYLSAYIRAGAIMEHGDHVVTAVQFMELTEESSRRLKEISGGKKND